MEQEQKISVPEGWRSVDYAEPGADTGVQSKNLELVKPGPHGKGEDDYHSKYVDPDGSFGAAKVGGAEDSYGGEGGEDQEKPEGQVPTVPQGWGLQAPPYPKRHAGVASSY